MQIIVKPNDLFVDTSQTSKTFTRILLPEQFIHWQSEARLVAFDRMSTMNAHAVKNMPAHLPVFATMSEGDFPVNLTTRGIGLLPQEAYLEEITQQLWAVVKESQNKPWEETLQLRVKTIRSFYQQPEIFDRGILGGLEIFEGQTLQNLKEEPRAALLYSGEPPKYPSYQFNGIVQLISREDKRYQFLLAARELFARDAFHIHQINYPNGYLFYPVEVKDKTPYPRR